MKSSHDRDSEEIQRLSKEVESLTTRLNDMIRKNEKLTGENQAYESRIADLNDQVRTSIEAKVHRLYKMLPLKIFVAFITVCVKLIIICCKFT